MSIYNQHNNQSNSNIIKSKNNNSNINNSNPLNCLENSEDEDSSVDSEEKFSKFIKDQKHYLRAKNFKRKRLNSTKKITESEVSDLLGEANNYYLNNKYDDVRRLNYIHNVMITYLLLIYIGNTHIT